MPFAAEENKVIVEPYIVYPSDKENSPDYKYAVTQAMNDVKKFYNEKAGIDFKIAEVKVVKASHNYEKLRCGPSPTQQCISNNRAVTTFERDGNWLSDECIKATGPDKTMTIKVVFCAGLGGMASGPENNAVVGDWVLQPISGTKNPWGIPCGAEYNDGSEVYCSRNAAVGTIVHEVGHSFGLDHPDNDPNKQTSVMMNHTGYPNVGFLPHEKTQLQEIPLLKMTSQPAAGGTETTLTVAPSPCVLETGKTQCEVAVSWTNAYEKSTITITPTVANQANTAVFTKDYTDIKNGNQKVGLAEGTYHVLLKNTADPSQALALKTVTVKKSDTAAADPVVNSPASDYSQYKDKESCERVIPQKTTYCTDNGRVVNEKTEWNGTACVAKLTDVKACTFNDEYKNGKKYTVPTGQAASGIAGGNKETVDNKVAPEVEKLAADCGFVQADQATLGIPFFKIGPGENLSINREDCKELLRNQLAYFEQANIRAKNRLEETAKDLGVEIVKDENGNYALKYNDPQDANKEGVKALAENLKTVNEAQTTIKNCKDKTGEEQAACLGETQAKTQKAAEIVDKAALKSSLDKLNQILDGKKPGGCVKADLGATPVLEAKRLKARGRGENPDPADGGESNDKGRRTFHRLLVCAGKNKQDLKYRVLVGGNAGEEFSNDGEDKGNDAERLYGLYGTDESYEGPPQFGSGFPINRCVTLTGNTADVIRKDLAIYIAAAENGTSAKAADGGPCKAESNPNDTGGNGSERRAGTTGSGTPTGAAPTGGTGSSGSANECTQSEKNKCADEGDDFVCTKPGGVYTCKVPTEKRCTTDDDCKNQGDKTNCHRSSGQCQRPATTTQNKCEGVQCGFDETCSRDTGQCVKCPGGVCP